MAVNDAGARRQECGVCAHRWFERPDARTLKPLDAFNAVGPGAHEEGVERIPLACGGRDDKLSSHPMRHTPLGAKGVQALPPCDAGARLHGIVFIVQAAVDHLGVPRTGNRSERCLRFENEHLRTRVRERARSCKADNARTDNHGIHESVRHAGTSTRKPHP